jgi:hypothetical protein
MTTAIIAVVGSLAGVGLGSTLGSTLSFLAQYSLTSRTRNWKLEDTKRQSYAEFLTSISASYARAKAREGDPEDADLLRATAVIELIAERKIAERARLLQEQVTEVHKRLRLGDSAVEQTEVPKADHARRELITLFKADLDIPPDGDNGQAAGRAGDSGQRKLCKTLTMGCTTICACRRGGRGRRGCRRAGRGCRSRAMPPVCP